MNQQLLAISTATQCFAINRHDFVSHFGIQPGPDSFSKQSLELLGVNGSKKAPEHVITGYVMFMRQIPAQKLHFGLSLFKNSAANQRSLMVAIHTGSW